LDGFSDEFYKTFWNAIKALFLDNLNFSLMIEELCPTRYEGVVTLIPKPGKDPLLVTNFRLLTLLNCDYKILSKVINNRLCNLLSKLINNDQNDIIQGRNIGDNIRLMFDIIDYANHKKCSRSLNRIFFFFFRISSELFLRCYLRQLVKLQAPWQLS